MNALPTVEQALSLPAAFDQVVSEDFIDENGHMNITDYFRLATWAPWLRMVELGMGEDYIATRGMSFFTTEHQIRYLAELRLGERFSVHSGFAGRTAKALHAVGVVVDREHHRLACVLEVMYVHVSMAERRSTPIPDDLAAALDAEMAVHGVGWLPAAAHGLTLHRTAPAGSGTLPA
ncbi:MAG: thioesterase family protein [Nocardioides sp.]|nr:thioesterase family protein [Nocardioides sp.]